MTTPNPYSPEALHARVDNDFTLHPPKDPHIGNLMDELRTEFRTLAHLVIDRCPSGPDLSVALRCLDDGLKNAIAAIARDQEAVLARDGIIPDPR